MGLGRGALLRVCACVFFWGGGGGSLVGKMSSAFVSGVRVVGTRTARVNSVGICGRRQRGVRRLCAMDGEGGVGGEAVEVDSVPVPAVPTGEFFFVFYERRGGIEREGRRIMVSVEEKHRSYRFFFGGFKGSSVCVVFGNVEAMLGCLRLLIVSCFYLLHLVLGLKRQQLMVDPLPRRGLWLRHPSRSRLNRIC